ncbi:uncharacterized protein EKO05_0006609 [Ascochyta rabiei]|uniref:uncharacterized protein n=1 Tax=Didymella rabiei TaxID=5454 RepID=UPI00220E4FF3|nr:uncharacterized protein EKO05_0006609 [Ascochyta rabiei]UPX16195.1 hypothetical protein EKO05_0006609 [Ascochyta rabiei]
MSGYSSSSSSSSATKHNSFNTPPAREYRLPTMSPTHPMSLVEKHETLLALHQHRINTLPDLRRTERALAQLNTPDVSAPMTAAWTYYVASHSLLTELRGFTKNYPFSSHCVAEAKRRVFADPQSNCSWNLAWLVLRKIEDDQLIAYYARHQASQPATWGGLGPSSEQVGRLADAIGVEWKWALDQMLRHWETPPTR